MEAKPCNYCGTNFPRKAKEAPSRWAARKYCNRSCFGKAFAANPEFAARKLAAIQERYDRPGERARHAERMRQTSKRIWADPAIAARLTEAARERAHRTVDTDLARERASRPEARARAAANYSRTVLKWCPEEHQAEYRRLRKLKYSAPEARRMVEQEIAAVARRAVAKSKADMIARRDRERAQAY